MDCIVSGGKRERFQNSEQQNPEAISGNWVLYLICNLLKFPKHKNQILNCKTGRAVNQKLQIEFQTSKMATFKPASTANQQ